MRTSTPGSGVPTEPVEKCERRWEPKSYTLGVAMLSHVSDTGITVRRGPKYSETERKDAGIVAKCACE